ncbi:hypothetical protein F5Y06DRAFT_299917 [Hypoxylon sp. FL0890]|nr:hypothetical protein F5Y06DRAFT_299917 [Hypoxylon sp. FL0890]
MVRFTVLATLAIALPAFAIPTLQPDPAGDKNVGNGHHIQFIGAKCLDGTDCESFCCAGVAGTDFGLCSGVGAQTQSGKTGCGFVDKSVKSNTTQALATGNSTCSN